MSDESWMNNPALGDIDPGKLQMLSAMAEQMKGKKQNEMLPFLMSLMSQPQSESLSFQSSEADAIIQVLKMGKTPQEIARIEKICTLMKQIRK